MDSEQSFKFFPQSRMSKEFPLSAWIIGWIAIYKAFLWLATDPNVADANILVIAGYKYLFFMIPFLLFGIGIWNLRKWAVWGIAAASVADLLFFLVYHPAFTTLQVDVTSSLARILTLIMVGINGPVSDILILVSIPFLIKHSKNFGQETEK
ncbi:hypothetical protein QUF76_08790 [Desulfobacterales bacterium HSG16]|nr:hypothetical protein [Desulfobacterales bacterium HSG16]